MINKKVIQEHEFLEHNFISKHANEKNVEKFLKFLREKQIMEGNHLSNLVLTLRKVQKRTFKKA